MIKSHLEGHGYGETSLVATSLCCDELARPLERELTNLYGSYFAFGGLAGFPFGGVTAFNAMAHHIPDGGSCVVVYGPHVGVDRNGTVGTVERRGRMKCGGCCGSGVAAHTYVQSVMKGQAKIIDPPMDPLDAQQSYVSSMLLPYGPRLAAASDPMTQLPFALFDAQDELMRKIIAKGCSSVSGEGKIAMIGGIQINTPPGMSDYFMPLRFDVLNNKGIVVDRIIRAPSSETTSMIMQSFPKAIPNAALVNKLTKVLGEFGFGNNSLLATSLCCDEVNRTLETELCAVFGDHFNMGGLAGFPFGGVTSFGAMAHHIPDGGSCIIVYGPHVGVDGSGKVGTVERRGRAKGGTCCGSAVAAAMYVATVFKGGAEVCIPVDPLDSQQAFVGKMLLPHAERLDHAKEPMVELPYALFDAQDELMQRIVAKGCSEIGNNGTIALLGGIQINTDEGTSDYFLPIRFDLLNNKGDVIKKLSFEA